MAQDLTNTEVRKAALSLAVEVWKSTPIDEPQQDIFEMADVFALYIRAGRSDLEEEKQIQEEQRKMNEQYMKEVLKENIKGLADDI